MTSEEFRRLAQTYGSVVARWPMDERQAVEVYLASHPEAARQVLAEAETLDLLMDTWLPLGVGQDLRERIVGLAKTRAQRRSVAGWLWPTGIGLGLASACAAGLVLGVSLSVTVNTTSTTDEPVNAVMTGYELPGPSDVSSGIT